MKILAFIFLVLNLYAQDVYSIRVAYGKITDSDLYQILTGNIKTHTQDFRVLAIDAGYMLEKDVFDSPVDVYIHSGISRFFEDNNQTNVNEALLYIKAYWNFNFKRNRIRFGLGEGISYTNHLLTVEYEESLREKDNHSRLLNYLDISLDCDFGRLIARDELYGTRFGWAIKHRSGIFGLVNNVRKSGSNYNTFYIEKIF